MIRHLVVQMPQNRALELHVLGHRFDDEVTTGAVVEIGGESDPIEEIGTLPFLQLSPRDGALGRVFDSLASDLDSLLGYVDGLHAKTMSGDNLGDSRSHGAQADDSDTLDHVAVAHGGSLPKA